VGAATAPGGAAAGSVRGMTVKLHRCPFRFLHTDLDACWKVQRALDEQGIDYEIVTEWRMYPKGSRSRLKQLSGQTNLPVLEFEDGSVYREESSDMAARIRAGELGVSSP